MTQLSREQVDTLIKCVKRVLDQTVQDKKDVSSIYSSVDPKNDARITAFSKLIDIFRTMQLCLILVSKHMLDRHWWQHISKNPIGDRDLQSYINGFSRFTKFGLVQGSFSCVESSLRVFLLALDPGACDAGRASFEAIYKCLLHSKLSNCPPDGLELLHLFRLVRNTIHNNGVHFSKSGKDETIHWKGSTYEFKQGHSVRGITLDFILTVSDELRSLLRTIVEDSKLKAITHEITDPAGPYGP